MGKVTERAIVDDKTSIFLLCTHVPRSGSPAQFIEGHALPHVARVNAYGSSFLIHKGAKMIVGGDYSEETIEYARLHYSKDRLSFLRLDAQQMPFRNNSFNVIVSLETIEHLKRYEDFLHDCKRMLKEDGIFICSTPNRKASFDSRDPYHFREFSVDELYELMARYFAETKLYGQDFLKTAAILKRELLWRLTPIIHSIPRSIQIPLRRLLFPENYLVSLAEIDIDSKGAFHKIVGEKSIPPLLTQTYPLPQVILCQGSGGWIR